MNFIKKYSYKSILIYTISLFLILIFTLFITINYFHTVDEITELTSEQQENNLKLLNNQIESQVSFVEGQSVILGRQRRLQNVIRGNASYYEMNILSTDISNIVYTSPLIDSAEVYFNGTLPPQYEDRPVKYGKLDGLEDSIMLNILGDDNAKWIGIREFQLHDHSKTVISYAKKLRNFRGEVHALLVMNIDPLFLNNSLSEFSDTSDILLINRHDQVLASSGNYVIGSYYSSPFDLNNADNSVHQSPDNELVVLSDFPNMDWQTVNITPADYLTRTSKRISFNMLVISLILIVLALMLAMLFVSRLTYPFRILINLMNDYKLNRTIQKIPTDYNNEFGRIFEVYKNLIERNEYLLKKVISNHKMQKRSEMKALQANINPHFLYNTLDQLNWRAIGNDDEEMSNMIELLGEMLRIGLANGKSIITVEEEAQYLDKYLQLQSIRLNDNLNYKIHIDDTIKDSFIPKLTLQPFVENSIIHGFNKVNGGTLDVNITDSGENTISILIDDDGSGAETFDKTSKKNTGGYGIKNVRERLNNYYNKTIQMKISNKLPHGVRVLIEIPNIKDKKDMSVLN